MSEKKIFIVDEICNRCGTCVTSCPFDAMRMEEGSIRIDAETCTLCGLCVKACPQDAIRLERSSRVPAADGHRDVWVFVEYRTTVHLPCLQVVSKGYDLARKIGDRLVAVVVGKPPIDSEALRTVFESYGVDEIRLLTCRQLAAYQPEDVAEVLRRDIVAGKPRIVLFLGSHFGRALAPRVAAKLQTGLTADCTELLINEDGKLLQIRPTYGGRILASILCQFTFPQMASVRQNVFEVVKRDEPSNRLVITEKRIDVESIERLKKVLRTEPLSRCSTPIEEAEIVVCGGLGLGSKDGFALLEALAEKIGGVVAGTREVVDRGWMGFSQQIGQTGKAVRPRLYIGCGVSGAIHHMIGMKHSRNVIAINSDPRAPIFRIASVGIVGDLYKILPPLIRQL
jgi:electron transfer flavoprotein alpha subunit/NAD-dependent dihydropyrimidine dehydrogenase PreA subunit